MPDNMDEFSSIPFGKLGIIALPGCEEIGRKIDHYIVEWREKRESEHKTTIAFAGYQKPTYLMKVNFPRFGTGEAKASISQSVRGYDIFIVPEIPVPLTCGCS